MGGNSTSNGGAYGITKNGRNSGTLLHSTCLVFFPKFSITILWPRRRRKIIQTVSLLRLSQEKKRFEMDGVSLRKPSAECKVPKKDETIHIIRDRKKEKEIGKVDLFLFPLNEWKHIWKFFRVEISQLNEDKAQQSSGAVRCAQTEETARSLKQKVEKQRRTFISVFHKSHPNCINKINKRKQVLEG